MTEPVQLPEGFATLEPFVARWSLRTSAERDRARGDSTEEEREAFYAAAQPLLEAALSYLDGFPARQLGEKEQRLMDLVLSLAHVSLAVEVQKEMEEQHARQRNDMPITRSVTDPA
ncbi:MAG: hypothetical protein H6917_06390 [Novosphingobium sp.]|nr:hypothetical protein [Novosphingobium sp.]MCP5401998.1 hypothetical protein [Novosphingobium sp.]